MPSRKFRLESAPATADREVVAEDGPRSACRICRRPLSDALSMRLGIGPTCRRKARAATEADPSAAVRAFDWRTMDVELIRGPDGEGWHGLPQVVRLHEGDSHAVDWGHREDVDGRMGRLAESILRLFVSTPNQICRHSFMDDFLVDMPREGGTIRGADVRAWLLDRFGA